LGFLSPEGGGVRGTKFFMDGQGHTVVSKEKQLAHQNAVPVSPQLRVGSVFAFARKFEKEGGRGGWTEREKRDQISQSCPNLQEFVRP